VSLAIFARAIPRMTAGPQLVALDAGEVLQLRQRPWWCSIVSWLSPAACCTASATTATSLMPSIVALDLEDRCAPGEARAKHARQHALARAAPCLLAPVVDRQRHVAAVVLP